MNSRDLLNAPKTYALIQALKSQGFDVHPGGGLYTALMDLAHVEATKTSELVKEFQRANPVAVRIETSEEARRVIEMVRSEERKEIARLKRGFEGVKDWAARSGAIGLEQWCSEALSPTGKLATFPPALTPTIEEHEEETAALYGERHEQGETIKALADALEDLARHTVIKCYCSGVGSHTLQCRNAVAALRLAGRL